MISLVYEDFGLFSG